LPDRWQSLENFSPGNGKRGESRIKSPFPSPGEGGKSWRKEGGGENWKERREQKKREGKVPEKSGEKKELAIFFGGSIGKERPAKFRLERGKGRKREF
jgi:hypothetical protein